MAAGDGDDRWHEQSMSVLSRSDIQLVVPAMVIAEVCYLLGQRMGPAVEAQFLRGAAQLDVEAPTPEDFERMAELVEQYGDFPLGATDASVVALAERLDTRTIVTLDQRHFGQVRPRHCESFELLP